VTPRRASISSIRSWSVTPPAQVCPMLGVTWGRGPPRRGGGRRPPRRPPPGSRRCGPRVAAVHYGSVWGRAGRDSSRTANLKRPTSCTRPLGKRRSTVASIPFRLMRLIGVARRVHQGPLLRAARPVPQGASRDGPRPAARRLGAGSSLGFLLRRGASVNVLHRLRPRHDHPLSDLWCGPHAHRRGARPVEAPSLKSARLGTGCLIAPIPLAAPGPRTVSRQIPVPTRPTPPRRRPERLPRLLPHFEQQFRLFPAPTDPPPPARLKTQRPTSCAD
jgi:hypothetical protein